MGRFKLEALFLLWLVAFGISTTNGQQAGTNCSDPRVRRSWEMYNASEKALYLEAVGIAMDKGYHMKFIQVHTETQSEYNAHRNCMFIYWHRMMLLGYENMLRSLDPKFRCLTLPYWDHVSSQARLSAGNCTTLQNCSPFVADSGGTLTGVTKSLNIYGTTIGTSSSTLCINQGPLSHFCGNNTPCASCITRTKGSGSPYPGSASFSSVYQQVFTYSSYDSFRGNVENGVHNIIHSTLGGVMGYLQSPADPIFYLHHGLVDLLQVIYLKCQLGAENVLLTADAKGSDPRWFSTCARRAGGYYTSADNITMRGYAYDGKTIVNVWQDPKNILYPFFKDLPYRYADYVDAKDLGNYSYTYAISGGLANMYKNCKASNTISSTDLNLTTTLVADEIMEPPRGHLCPVIEPGTSYDEKVKRWNIALYESARIVGYEEAAAREQVEMAMCQYQVDCLGGVVDYTQLFKTNFGVDGHPRCYTIMQYLDSGDRVIGIPKWKDITNRFLPCSKYAPRPKTAFEKAFAQYANGLGNVKIADDYTTTS
uniref:Tyrosinase copper-binding domain-containing protein n=1 Tax=Phytophthora ramorum TaxID=164328 RepID=H3GFA7_PHYRM